MFDEHNVRAVWRRIAHVIDMVSNVDDESALKAMNGRLDSEPDGLAVPAAGPRRLSYAPAIDSNNPVSFHLPSSNEHMDDNSAPRRSSAAATRGMRPRHGMGQMRSSSLRTMQHSDYASRRALFAANGRNMSSAVYLDAAALPDIPKSLLRQDSVVIKVS